MTEDIIQDINPIAMIRNKRYAPLDNHIKSGSDLDVANRSGLTPLHVASVENDAKAIGMLLSGGANPDIRDEKGKTPALLATERGYEHALAELIKFNCDLSIKDNEGFYPLLASLKRTSNNKVSILLIEAGSPVNQRGYNDTTPLSNCIARSNGNFPKLSNVITSLIKNGADIEKINQLGFTPLMVAVENNDIETMKTLINAGADTNHSIDIKPESIDKLSPYGYDLDYKYEKEYPLHIALTKSKNKNRDDNFDIIQLLLDNGADLYAQLSEDTKVVDCDYPDDATVRFIVNYKTIKEQESIPKKVIRTRRF